MSASSVINRREMDFLLRDWLNISALLDRPHFAAHSTDSIDAIITLAQDLAERELVPLLRPSDIEEPSMGVDGQMQAATPSARYPGSS
jgi:butyryl-CoA dehydrogenase